MKKIIALILAAMMLLTLVACDTNDNNEDVNNEDNVNDNNNDENTGDENTGDENTGDENTGDETPELAYGSAVEILTSAWNAFADDQKFFVMGGDYTTPVDGAPGKFDLTAEGANEALDGMTHYPVAEFAKIDDAATIMHGMLANNFTGAAYHFTSADNATAMVEVLKNTLLETQWWCGFPEKLVIISVPGDYLVVLFGLGEGAVDVFTAKTLETIEGATVIVEQNF